MGQRSRQQRSGTNSAKFRCCDAGKPPSFEALNSLKQLHSSVAWVLICTSCRGTRFRQVGHTVLPTDLSPVIDARSRVSECQGSKTELLQLNLPIGSEVAPALEGMVNQEGDGPFALRSHPGCVIFPGWLTPQAQIQIACDSFTVFPDAPAKTNHSARFGDLAGLWRAAQAEQVLQETPDAGKPGASANWDWVGANARHLDKKGEPRPGVVTAKRLWQELRWAALGPAYGVPPVHTALPSMMGAHAPHRL